MEFAISSHLRVLACCLAVLFQAALPGCSEETSSGIRSAEELTAALAAAAPGDVVRLGEGTFRGSFRVPAGVAVEGAGSGTIVVAEGGGGFLLEAGPARAATVRALTIRTELGAEQALAGVVISGTGDATLADLELDIQAGIGIVASFSGRLTVELVAVRGGLTEESLDALSDSVISPADAPVAGLFAAGPGLDVAIAGLEVHGFAGFGVIFSSASGTWTDGRVTNVAGTSVLVEQSAIALRDVRIADAPKSDFIGPLDTSFGLVVSAGSTLETERVEVARVAGPGLLQDAARSSHAALRVVDNDGPGIWVQHAPDSGLPTGQSEGAPSLELTDSVIRGNQRVGLQLLDIDAAVIRDSLISDTLGELVVTDEAGVRTVRDGLQLTNPAERQGHLEISGSLLFGHGRVALLADGSAVSVGTEGMDGENWVCGSSMLGEEWGCEIDGEGRQSCLRSSGPVVGPGWRCGDSAGGTICRTSDAGLLDGEPDEALDAAGLPDEAACGTDLSALVEGLGLETGLGLSDELVNGGARPFLEPAATRWTCETDGGTRTCIDSHGDDGFAIDDRDNPTTADVPGWDCADTASGRRCIFSGNGILPRAGADVEALASQVNALVAARDEDVLAGDLQNGPGFVPSSAIPSICAGESLCAGVIGTGGVTGGAAPIGSEGIIDLEGRVRAGVGENGFE